MQNKKKNLMNGKQKSSAYSQSVIRRLDTELVNRATTRRPLTELDSNVAGPSNARRAYAETVDSEDEQDENTPPTPTRSVASKQRQQQEEHVAANEARRGADETIRATEKHPRTPLSQVMPSIEGSNLSFADLWPWERRWLRKHAGWTHTATALARYWRLARDYEHSQPDHGLPFLLEGRILDKSPVNSIPTPYVGSAPNPAPQNTDQPPTKSKEKKKLFHTPRSTRAVLTEHNRTRAAAWGGSEANPIMIGTPPRDISDILKRKDIKEEEAAVQDSGETAFVSLSPSTILPERPRTTHNPRPRAQQQSKSTYKQSESRQQDKKANGERSQRQNATNGSASSGVRNEQANAKAVQVKQHRLAETRDPLKHLPSPTARSSFSNTPSLRTTIRREDRANGLHQPKPYRNPTRDPWFQTQAKKMSNADQIRKEREEVARARKGKLPAKQPQPQHKFEGVVKQNLTGRPDGTCYFSNVRPLNARYEPPGGAFGRCN